MLDFIISLSFVILSILFAIYCFKRTNLLSYKLKNDTIFTHIIGAAPDMIFIIDSEMNILDVVNHIDEDLIMPRAEILGMNFTEVFNDGTEKARETMHKVIATKETMEIELTAFNGQSAVFYEGRCIYLNPTKVVFLLRNITRRKELEHLAEKNRRLLEAVVESLPFPVMMKDISNDLRYVYWNKACELSGYLNNEVIGKNDKELYGNEWGKNSYKADSLTALSDKAVRYEEDYYKRNGECLKTIAIKKAIHIGDEHILVATRWDITPLLNTQQQLKQIIAMNDTIISNSNYGFVYLSPFYLVLWQNLTKYSNHPFAIKYQENRICYRHLMNRTEPCENCIMKKSIDSGKQETKLTRIKDAIFEIQATPVFRKKDNRELEGIVLRFRDVTNEPETQKWLSQKPGVVISC